jgi:hypothetical protein
MQKNQESVIPGLGLTLSFYLSNVLGPYLLSQTHSKSILSSHYHADDAFPLLYDDSSGDLDLVPL